MFMLNLAVSLNPNFVNDYLEYLGEFAAIYKTSLARESKPQGDCSMKKLRIENLVTLPL
jgi:hypothetical protein